MLSRGALRRFHKISVFVAAMFAAMLAGAPMAAAAVTATLTPIAGPPTTSVTISGSGFPASTAVNIYFDTTNLALAVSNSTGAFSIGILVPSSAVPGTHWVTAVALGSSGTAAQAPYVVRTNWAQFHYSPLHRGRNPYENVLNSTNVAAIDLDWSYTTGGALTSSPAVSAGTVYVGSADDYLYAINATTGALVWRFKTGNSIVDSTPAVVGGVVYVGSTDNYLYAVNATTGTQKWKFQTGGAINSSPAVVNGTVYVGSADNNVYALNATTGAQKWKFPTGSMVLSSPAVSNGVVYVGSYDNNVYAIKDNGTSGTQLWKFTTGGKVFSSPAVSGGLIYVGSDDGSAYGLVASTGMQQWKYTPAGTPYAFESSPAAYGGNVYIGSDQGYFYALVARNGSVIWNVGSVTPSIVSSPCIANGIEYVGIGNNVYALSQIVTAQVLWVAITGASVTATPTVVNGVVYVASQDSTLYAYDLNGSNLAKLPPVRPDPASLQPDPTLAPTISK